MNVWITDQCEALNSYLELHWTHYWIIERLRFLVSDSCLILYLSVRLLFIMLMSLFKLIHAVVFQVMVQCRWMHAMLCTKIHVARKSLKQKCTCKFKRITLFSVRRVYMHFTHQFSPIIQHSWHLMLDIIDIIAQVFCFAAWVASGPVVSPEIWRLHFL